MPISFAYLFVVLIWATTPLAIQWSIQTMSPITSVTLRMLISLAIVMVVALFFQTGKFELKRHWRLYLASGLGICPAMPLVYLASQYIPSGLVSVMFGLSPFIVGILSSLILKDHSMTRGRYIALFVASLGLAIIFLQGDTLGKNAFIGMALLLMAVALFALSSIFVKRFAEGAGLLQQLRGSLTVATIGLLVWWFLFDRQLPEAFTLRSLGALLYLSIAGSFLAFIAYFYLIQRISVNLVTLIPLVTPALALWLGYFLNDESVTPRLILGSILIVLGLALFNHMRPSRASII